MIRFQPNDPHSGFGSLTIAASPVSGSLAFDFHETQPAEQVYAVNDARFIHWQVREAALRTLSLWDHINPGVANLPTWVNGQHTLRIHSNAGVGLQAAYDRHTLKFDRWGSVPFFVGSSADAVTHEVGHALLDALRPELWHSVYPEIVAFHEAFADCLCLFACLLDKDQRDALLDQASDMATVLDSSNGASRIAESVAHEYASSFSATEPSATVRDALNDFEWEYAHALPGLASGDVLTNEPHSFSRVFAGCIYDCIRKAYSASISSNGSANRSIQLESATLTVARLLVEATKNVPEGQQIFRRLGEAMVHADTRQNDGNNIASIMAAFAEHNLDLNPDAMVTPTEIPASSSTVSSSRRRRWRRRGSSVGLMPETRQEVESRLGLPEALRLTHDQIRLGKKSLVRTHCFRDLALGSIDGLTNQLAVRISDAVMLDLDDAAAPLMDVLPNLEETELNIRAFVGTLLENNLLMESRSIPPTGIKSDLPVKAAFAVRQVKGKAVLRRIRCACHARNAKVE